MILVYLKSRLLVAEKLKFGGPLAHWRVRPGLARGRKERDWGYRMLQNLWCLFISFRSLSFPFISLRFLSFRFLFPFLLFPFLSLPVASFRLNHSKIMDNSNQIWQKSSNMDPKTIKHQPKWLSKQIRAPRSIWDAQKGTKMDPKWSQRCQNGPQMEPKGFQNLCKIGSKIYAEIHTENIDKWCNNTPTTVPK